VVDDTEEVIDLFREILTSMGHRVSATAYAPEDLAEVIRVKPDLVVLDIVINGERRGWQLAQKMRMSPETEAIPIIVCTAATDAVREQEGWLVAQAIKVVLKPFSISDLELAVSEAFELPDIAV
jgi:CheY-like chemotaxis protein